LVYRIVEKSTLVVFFSYPFVHHRLVTILNEKVIMRRKIERVKDAMMSLSYSGECVIKMRRNSKGSDRIVHLQLAPACRSHTQLC
jgi:hypothetical protein